MTRPVVVEENGRKFTVVVPKSAKSEKIRVDGGLINSNKKKKCDWAIRINPNEQEHFFFVELKGTDLLYAIDQLEATIVELRDLHKAYADKQAHAVCSRVIPHFQSGAQNAAVRFKKKYGFVLRWHSNAGTTKCANCG